VATADHELGTCAAFLVEMLPFARRLEMVSGLHRQSKLDGRAGERGDVPVESGARAEGQGIKGAS
jgi:hypothetical protein